MFSLSRNKPVKCGISNSERARESRAHSNISRFGAPHSKVFPCFPGPRQKYTFSFLPCLLETGSVLEEREENGIVERNLDLLPVSPAGTAPRDLNDFLPRQMKRFAFRDQPLAGEEKASGWTSVENVLDTQFEYANESLGDYLAFAFRLDRKSVPPSLLKLRFLEAEKKALSAKAKKFSFQGRKGRDQRAHSPGNF